MLDDSFTVRLTIRKRLFARPCLRNRLSLGYVVHDQDQLVIVVAVERLDVDPSLGHRSRDLAELTLWCKNNGVPVSVTTQRM